MRPPRLVILAFCFIFFPIFLTFFSALTSSPSLATPSSFAGRATGLHAFFSFNIPSSLFPPSAIISLTDDNSTFFLARPAAFGPLLPEKSLSGQLWVGSGFGERNAAGAEGELGCSDIPGWGEGEPHRKQDKSIATNADPSTGKSASGAGTDPVTSSQNHNRADSQQDTDSQNHAKVDASSSLLNDGTDDHLHHPLPESHAVDASAPEQHGDNHPNRQTAHADIQSLQESAEINGKVVLLTRGGCGFLEKVKWVQRRGGIALIVGDDTRGGSLVTMYARGDTSNVTIPALFTSHTTAQLLSSLVPPQTEDAAAEDGSGASHAKLASHSIAKQRLEPTTITTAIISPTSSQHPKTEITQSPAPSQAGIFHGLMSLLGMGGDGRHAWRAPEDSRRPPSSGNINWVLMDNWNDQETPRDDYDHGYGRTKGENANEDRKRSETESDSVDGDGFVIGVQDWRDPDLVAPRSSAIPSPSSVPEPERVKLQTATDKGSRSTPAPLKGGSITPGSGEYRTFEKSSVKKGSHGQSSQNLAAEPKGPSTRSNGWFARHFWVKDKEPESSRTPKNNHPEGRKMREAASQTQQNAKPLEHEGLWITLTPTSMSTSPFFDTLLVLVVSPLLTLTIVYALLLLRSRIRRRRWRAPKSLVERLPVRTYHTISTSTSSTSSLRSASPGPVSPTSPLLGSKTRAGLETSRPQPERLSGTFSEPKSPPAEPRKENAGSSSTLWRRKYTGRQVECVVCLEEYVDGQSRVMSLPCGHEFHVECITPWLTTRRRTCPICKGDVVRSMSQNKPAEARESIEQTAETSRPHGLESYRSSSSAPVPITSVSEDEMSDPERHGGSDAGLLEGHSSSAPPPSWRNYAALSFSALSGDTIWHPGHPSRANDDR